MNSDVRIPSLFLLAALAAIPAAAGQVQVAVAANFTAPMRQIAAAFERDSGHKALLAFGSTGRFHAQIRNGAPFELLLAADDETPAKLEQEGLAVKGTRFTYAIGHLVLWSAQPGVVDAEGRALREGSQARLAIADPRLAPYGAAALQVLQRLNVLARWQTRLVQGESIGQAWQFVATGNAPLGFVALAQVQVEGRIASGSGWVVPAELHEALKQDAVLLKGADANPAATALAVYLRGEAARAVMRSYGYTF